MRAALPEDTTVLLDMDCQEHEGPPDDSGSEADDEEDWQLEHLTTLVTAMKHLATPGHRIRCPFTLDPVQLDV